MTDSTSTPAPDDVIEGAFITEPSGELFLAERGATISAEEGVTFRPATRAEVEDQGFEVAEDGSVVPKVESSGAPADVEGPADAAPARRRRGTVTDRIRREAEEAKAGSDG